MIAITQIVGGGTISIFFTVVYITARALENMVGNPAMASRFFFLILLGTMGLIIRGIWNAVLYARYRKLFRAIISRNGATTLQQIANELNTSPAKVLADIESTINRRYWSGYGLTETTLVLVDASNNSGTVLSSPDMTFKEGQKRSRSSLWFFAATWAVALAFGALSVWYGPIAVLILSIIALIVSAQLLPRKIRIEQKIQRVEEYKPEPVKTGDEDTDDLLGEGLGYVQELVELDRTINDEKLDKPVKELLDITRQIFDYIKKAPEKSKQVRQFVKYYLPTTIKLLKNYDELSRQPVKGENITEAIRKIEGIMDGILFTFRQQLDDLYRDKNIDISSDISVMENMINQDELLSNADVTDKKAE
jgi:DNA-binding Lrp family transcriptional regulator